MLIVCGMKRIESDRSRQINGRIHRGGDVLFIAEKRGVNSSLVIC